jgi:surface antigen
MLALVALFAAAVSGCSAFSDATDMKMPEFTMPDMKMPDIDLSSVSLTSIPKPGVLFDKAPPDVEVQRGGPSGELLAGPMLPVLPDANVETSIGPSLRDAMTPIERRQLAEASQRAVLGITGTPVRWKAVDSGGSETARGVAMPVDDTQRSVRGRLCRDLWQSIEKKGEPLEQQVTLCRHDYGNGLSVWVVGDANQWP